MTDVAGMLRSRLLLYQYDTAATTNVFRRYSTENSGWGGIETSGSSTTVTAMSGLATPPFNDLGVGDLLAFRMSGSGGTVQSVTNYRLVSAKASGSSITVSSAIDLTGGISSWSFYHLDSGTTAADGWVFIGDLQNPGIVIDAPTIGHTDGVIFTIQGKGGEEYAPLVQLWTATVAQAAAGYTKLVRFNEDASEVRADINFVRLGVKGATAFSGTDVLNAYIVGKQVH